MFDEIEEILIKFSKFVNDKNDHVLMVKEFINNIKNEENDN